ncbi:tail fiber domain-containing protein [Pseudomonas sp. X10]
MYANTGAINTSDAREKTQVIALTENEIKAAKLLSREIGTYKWLAMVAQKGDGARLHIGMTVQRAIAIMESCDLNPFDYGFICYDQWADEYEDREATYETVYDDDGNAEKIELMSYERVKVSDAGDRYSFRHDELLLFIAAGVEARLAALEEAAL